MSSNRTAGSHPRSVDPSKWAWYNKSYSHIPERHVVTSPTTTITKSKAFSPFLFALAVVLFAASLAPYLWEWVTEGEVPDWSTLLLGATMLLGTLSIIKVPGLVFMRKVMFFVVLIDVLIVGILLVNGAPLVALAIYGSAVAVALGYLAAKSSFAVRSRTYTQAVSVLDNGTRVFGKPGGVADAVGVFGKANVDAGVAGEKATAELLSMLLRIPGTFIYHGLKFPGSDNADVDHAVVNGNNVILIDSKQFRAGDYSWAYSEDGKELISSSSLGTNYENHMGAAVAGYKSQFTKVPVGSVNVTAVVMVHGQGVNIKQGGDQSKGNIILATPQDAMNIIGQRISHVPPDNRRLRQEMLVLLK